MSGKVLPPPLSFAHQASIQIKCKDWYLLYWSNSSCKTYTTASAEAEKDCFKSSGSGKRSSFWLVSLSSTSFSALSFLLLIFFMQNSQLTICQVTLPPFLGSNIHSKYLHCLLEFPSILARVCCLLIDLPATTNSLPPPPPCPTLFFLHFPSLSHKTFLGDVSVSSWSVSGLLSLSKECPNSPALVRALLPLSMPLPFPALHSN